MGGRRKKGPAKSLFLECYLARGLKIFFEEICASYKEALVHLSVEFDSRKINIAIESQCADR